MNSKTLNLKIKLHFNLYYVQVNHDKIILTILFYLKLTRLAKKSNQSG